MKTNGFEHTEQTERIARMESDLLAVRGAVSALVRALEGWEAVQDKLDGLEDYLVNGEWRRDFEDDEAGRLPPYSVLPRGVLTEDAISDLLDDRGMLRDWMGELAAGRKTEALPAQSAKDGAAADGSAPDGENGEGEKA